MYDQISVRCIEGPFGIDVQFADLFCVGSTRVAMRAMDVPSRDGIQLDYLRGFETPVFCDFLCVYVHVAPYSCT